MLVVQGRLKYQAGEGEMTTVVQFDSLVDHRSLICDRLCEICVRLNHFYMLHDL